MALSCFFSSRRGPGFLDSRVGERFACQGLGFIRHLDLYGSSLVGHPFSFDFSARADQVIAAEKLLAIIVASGAILAGVAFMLLEKGTQPILFILFLGLKSLITAPAWLVDHHHPEQHRSPGTGFRKNPGLESFSWMVAGWLVSLLAMDLSASVGWLSVGASILAAACCLLLPHCPPKGGPRKTLLDVLGLRAFRLFKQRDTAMFWNRLSFFHSPRGLLHAYASTTPVLGLRTNCSRHDGRTIDRGGRHADDGMVSEKLEYQGHFRSRLGMRTLRYLLYAWGASDDSLASVLLGIALHGICWTYFFEAGKSSWPEELNRPSAPKAKPCFRC